MSHPYKQNSFTQYWINVGPPSMTLAQHWPIIVSCLLGSRLLRSRLQRQHWQWLFLFLTNTKHWSSVDLMLFQSLRCCRDNKTALGQNLLHSGYTPNAGRIMCFSGALQSYRLEASTHYVTISPATERTSLSLRNLVQYITDCFFLV